MAQEKIGEAFVSISAKLGPLRRGLKNAAKMVGRVIKQISVMSVALFSAAAAATLAWASSLEEATDKFTVAFQKMSAQGLTWVDKYSEQLGFGKQEMLDYMSSFNLMIKGTGVGEQKALDMSKALTKMAFGFSSLQNMSAGEAFVKIISGLAGEAEPLRRFGVDVTVAGLEAFAASKGIKKLYKEMTTAEKTTIRYQMILKGLESAWNNEIDTAGSLANEWRRLGGTIVQQGAEIGMVFAKDVAGAIGKISDAGKTFAPEIEQWLVGLREKAVAWIDSMGGIEGIGVKIKDAWATFAVYFKETISPILQATLTVTLAIVAALKQMADLMSGETIKDFQTEHSVAMNQRDIGNRYDALQAGETTRKGQAEFAARRQQESELGNTVKNALQYPFVKAISMATGQPMSVNRVTPRDSILDAQPVRVVNAGRPEIGAQ